MKIVSVILLVAFTVACATANKPIEPPPINLDPMPEEPTSEVQPDKSWVVSVESIEDCKDRKGILMSEEKAAGLAQYRVAYPGLRRFCELDRQLWSGKWQISQRLLLESERRREDEQPGWWGRNKGEIAFFGGLIVGAAVTIGIVFGVQEVKQ